MLTKDSTLLKLAQMWEANAIEAVRAGQGNKRRKMSEFGRANALNECADTIRLLIGRTERWKEQDKGRG